MADLASLRISVDSREVKSASYDLANLGNAAAKSEGSVNRLSSATRAFGGVLASIGIAAVVKQAIDLADTYNRMSAQIALVTKNASDLSAVEAQLFSMSQRTRVGYEATVELYTRMARSTQALGANQAAVARVTETINKALVVSGTSAEQASGALMQLGQGFASGALRGDELNSVMEGMPRVAKAIADGMGITVGELRKLGAQGKLTGSEVFNALLKMGNGIDSEFAKMPMTVGQSMTVLGNSVMKFIGNADNALGITGALSGAIVALSNNLDTIAVVAMAAAGAFAAIRAQMAITAVTSYISSLVSLEMALGATSTSSALFSVALKMVQGSFRSLTMTMMANPFVAIATAIAAVGVALYEMRDSQVKVGGETVRLGDIFLGVWQVIKNAISFVQRIFTDGWAEAFNYVSPALRSVGVFFGQVFSFIAKAAKTSINGIVGLFVGLGAAAKAIFTDESVVGAFQAAFNKDYVGAFSAAVGDGIVGLARMGKASRDAGAAAELATKPIGAIGGAAADSGKKAKEAAEKLKSLQDFLKSLRDETTQIGMTPEQVKAMEVEAKAAEAAALGFDKLAASIRGAGAAWQEATAKQKQADFIKNVIEPLESETSLLNANTAARAVANAELEMQRQGIDRNSEAWNRYLAAVKANEAGKQVIEDTKKAIEDAKKALEDFAGLKIDINFDAVFGNFGKAMGGVIAGFDAMIERQDKYAAAIKAAGSDQAKIAEVNAKNHRLEINSYANMTAAAKGFFKEGTTGYKVMQTAETAFRAAEIALALKSSLIKMGVITAESTAHATSEVAKTAATATGESARTGISIGAALARIPVKLAEGAASMFAALGPAGFAAVAGMAAVMAGFGFAISGGGAKGDYTSQNNKGTGTVFGDLQAQSESITKSIERLAEVNTTTMRYSSQMVVSLRNIEAAMTGVTSVLLRSSGFTNLGSNVQQGSSANLLQKAAGTAALAGTGAAIGAVVAGPVGAMVGAALGAAVSLVKGLVNSLFGTATKVVGKGVTGTAQSIADILASGFDVAYYTDIEKKKKFFGVTTSTSYQTQTTAADDEIKRQFGLIISNIYDTVLATAGPLNLATDQVAKNMEAFVLNIGKIDVQGLTGEQIQEKLSAVFGAAADNIAAAAIPGLEKFQKVGEGYFETLVRVASAMEVVNQAFAGMGMGAVGVDVGMALTELFGSAADFADKTSQFFELFYSEAEQVAVLTSQYADVFSRLNMVMPDSLDGYRKLVEGLDLSTAAGQQTYATLINLGPAFADYIDRQNELNSAILTTNSLLDENIYAHNELSAAIAEETQRSFELARQRRALEIRLLEAQGNAAAVLAAKREDELAATDELLQPLLNLIYAQEDATAAAQAAAKAEQERQRAIEEATKAVKDAESALRQAYEREAKVFDDTISKFSDLGKKLREFAATLLPLTGTGGASLAQLNDKFRTTIALARLGNSEAMAQVPEIGARLRDAIMANATDRISMLRQLVGLKTETESVAEVADRQVSIAQQQLDALNAQVSQFITLNENVLSVKDAIVALQAAQANLASVISNAAASQSAASTTVKAASGSKPTDGLSAAQQLYMDTLLTMQGQGTPSEIKKYVSGLSDYQSLASLAAVTGQYDAKKYSTMTGYETAADLSQKFGVPVGTYASGGFHSGGLRIVGENGPELEATGPSRIYNANQLSEMMGGGATADEVKALRDELKYAMFQIAKNTGKSYDLMNRWDGDGLPPERIVA